MTIYDKLAKNSLDSLHFELYEERVSIMMIDGGIDEETAKRKGFKIAYNQQKSNNNIHVIS